MNTLKYLLYASLGVAVVLLLTSDKAKEIRDKAEEKARENAILWKNKLARMRSTTDGVMSDLEKS